eukprot:TRINITY_DN2621_c1_g1_i1.p1 TRINITY_DN2621_c1_g1~~TRINITY_DN2621_c1_g1_i1.p1  ORF type:complete len:288 (+),score=50.74 TRINITY_DN2621_c1_g1_i1:445-1308(+)
MIRRTARMRREYLYRKSLEGKERDTYEKKRKIKQALESGTQVPTELREEYEALQADMAQDDDETEAPSTHIDDEYARGGLRDPKVFITTSRDPSSRLSQFVKELKFVFPNAVRVNRGNHVMSQLVESCRTNDVTDIVIVHEHRGEPDGLVVCHLPYGPTAYFALHNTVMRHDIEDRGTMSQAFPHLIFDNFNTKLGQRVQSILKYLFPVPKEDARRVISFVNRDDTVSFRHHVYKKEPPKGVELSEVGPRFEMQLYQITLGTIDQKEAEIEWTLRPYMNTAWKRQAL